MTTKLHSIIDGCGRPLVVLTGPGQGGDSPLLPAQHSRQLLEVVIGEPCCDLAGAHDVDEKAARGRREY